MKISLVFPFTSTLLAVTNAATYTNQSRLVGNIPKTAIGSNQTTLNWNATNTATFSDQSGLGTHALPHSFGIGPGMDPLIDSA